MKPIDPMARTFVETYRSGKHIAYQRSIEIKVKVNTDTVTDTVWNILENTNGCYYVINIASYKIYLIYGEYGMLALGCT